MQKRGILILTLILIIIPISLAQDCPSYDYDDPDFDWSIIDPDCIPEVPAKKLDYSKLRESQRKAMTPKQIAENFNNIENLVKDVDIRTAEEAIKLEYGVEVSLSSTSSSPTQIRDDVLYAGKDSKATLTAIIYNRGKFSINFAMNYPEGDLVFWPGENVRRLDAIPKTDKFIIQIDKAQDFAFNADLYNPQILSLRGRFAVQNGELRFTQLLGSSSQRVDGLEIQGKIGTKICFTPCPEETTYIHLESTKLSFRNIQRVIFKPSNNFIKVDEDDTLTIESTGDAQITVEKDQTSLSTITVKDAKEEVDIINGKQIITIEGSEVNTKALPSTSGAAPFALIVQDEQGNPLLGKPDALQKFFFDELGIMHTVPLHQGLDSIFIQESLKESRLIVDQVKKIGLFEIVPGRYGIGQVEKVIDSFKAQHDLLPENLKTSTLEIYIVPNDMIRSARFCPSLIPDLGTTLGCINSKNQIFLTPVGVYSDKAIYHEAAHAWHHILDNQAKPSQDLITLQLNLKAKYGLDEPPKVVYKPEYGRETPIPCEGCEAKVTQGWKITDEEKQQLITLSSTAFESSFSRRWKKIAGDIYGKYNREYERAAWADGTDSDTPNHGCYRAYGCSHLLEDVATWTEPFAIAKLALAEGETEKAQEIYDKVKNILETYNSRYSKKVDLLLEFGFITKEDYCKVVEC